MSAPRLPSSRHVPGTGSRPDRALLEAIKADCPRRISQSNWRAAHAYRYGFELYAHGYFWEAHEVWEPVWLATMPASSERRLLAGLIQLANACLKLEMGQPKAAVRLLDSAVDHIAEVRLSAARRQSVMGIDPAALVAAIIEFRGDSAGSGALPAMAKSALERRPVLPFVGFESARG